MWHRGTDQKIFAVFFYMKTGKQANILKLHPYATFTKFSNLTASIFSPLKHFQTKIYQIRRLLTTSITFDMPSHIVPFRRAYHHTENQNENCAEANHGVIDDDRRGEDRQQ